MCSRLLAPGLVVLALGATACGSGSSSSASSSKVPARGANAGRPSHVYRVRLIGAKAESPPGAPHGAGAAIIATHGRSLICWRFAHLHGFFNATFAHIHIGVKGKSGKIVVPLSTGPALHHQGCVPVSPVLIKAIERHPANYYLNIHSKQYPRGAVRAQL